MERKPYREIDLQDILLLCLRKWKMILLCGAAAAACVLLITGLFVTPQYRACATVYVNNARGDRTVEQLSEGGLAASRALVSTYIHVVESNRVLDEVAAELDGAYSVKQLREMLSAEQVEDTEILALYILHPAAEEAVRIADVVAKVAPAKIAEVVEGSSARVIDDAAAGEKPYTPDYLKWGVLAAATGLVLGAVTVTVRFLLTVQKRETLPAKDGAEDDFLLFQ